MQCAFHRHEQIADAHRGDGKRFIAHANEKLTAFVGLESAIRSFNSFDTGLKGMGGVGLRSNMRVGNLA